MIQGYSNPVFSAVPKDLGAFEPRRNHSKLCVIYTYINSRGHRLMTGTRDWHRTADTGTSYVSNLIMWYMNCTSPSNQYQLDTPAQ